MEAYPVQCRKRTMTEPPLFSRPYSRSSLRRPPLWRTAALALAGLALAGCSLTVPLGSLTAQRQDPPTTASIARTAAAPVGSVDAAPLPALSSDKSTAPTSSPAAAFAETSSGSSAVFAPTDWVYARGALGLALSGDGGGPPVPWANPETGTYGSFAPAAPAVAAAGNDCRAFIAERVKTGKTERFAGRACKGDGGAWRIAALSSVPATL